ncbi:hypothetical protein AAIH25_20335 [Arthrobacter crystallopoietes]|uniref:hypothetical protein n=1 Tax=Crystallibacter crystallopoietes TaxID=37928 RepID=UPI003D1F51BE
MKTNFSWKGSGAFAAAIAAKLRPERAISIPAPGQMISMSEKRGCVPDHQWQADGRRTERGTVTAPMTN